MFLFSNFSTKKKKYIQTLLKSPVAYYLLLLYITVMLNPLIPLVSDALAHAFNETIHIATVHAVYGEHHAANAVANAASDNDNCTKHAAIKSEETVAVHVPVAMFCLLFQSKNVGKNPSSLYLFNLPAIFLSNSFPPPKFS